MPQKNLAQFLFEQLRNGRALEIGHELRRQGRLESLLPAIGQSPSHGATTLDVWLDGLDRWQYEEGNLTPMLFFASRVWGLLSAEPVDADFLQCLTYQAFPCLKAGAPVDQICAVVEAQAALDAMDHAAWERWTARQRQESLRLLKWRELQGEVPAGGAAAAYAVLRGSTSHEGSDQSLGRPASAAVEALGGWAFGRELLATSRADTTAPEFVLLGASVGRIAEPAETAVACLTALLRLNGHHAVAKDFEAEVPIPNGGISLPDWKRLCRRVGWTVHSCQWPRTHGTHDPVLCRLRDGSCLLLIGGNVDWYRAYVPGLTFPFRWIDRTALRQEHLEFACTMSGEVRPQALVLRPLRRLKFACLARHAYRGEVLDVARRRALHAVASNWPDVSFEPPKIPEPSLAAVLGGHRSLGAPGSPFHGTYRQINLHGTAALLAWQQIPEAMQELFDNVAAMPAEADAGRLATSVATLFMDFLRIHPFLNGNRRTAMAFATALCERQGFVLDWSSLSRSELYYAVRCAAAGHSRVLEATLRSRLKRH
jgi:hypothetical protein